MFHNRDQKVSCVLTVYNFFFIVQEKRTEGLETKKRMEAEMVEAGEIIKARKEEKLARLTSGPR